jgi:hypothetical protein
MMQTKKIFDMSKTKKTEGGSGNPAVMPQVDKRVSIPEADMPEVRKESKMSAAGLKEGTQVNYGDENGAIHTGVLVADIEKGAKTALLMDSSEELIEVQVEKIMGEPKAGNKPKPKTAAKGKAKAEAKKTEEKKVAAKKAAKGKAADVKVVVKKENGFLIVKVPLFDEPALSTSKKNLIIASSRGDKETGLKFKNQNVIVGVNAYIKNV